MKTVLSPSKGSPLGRFFARPHIELEEPVVFDKLSPLLELVASVFRCEFHGLSNIPREGAALIVGNHGMPGFDFLFFLNAVYKETGRLSRGLAERILYYDPITWKLLLQLGIVKGSQRNAESLLRSGHLAVVYPGGAREALKKPHQRYKLLWDHSFGFIRLAMKTNVPIILNMAIGPDDTYRILGRMRWTGKLLGNDRYELPLWFGWGALPRPVKFIYYISEPIELEGGPEDVDDGELVKRNHERVRMLGQAMLDEGVKRRRSVWFG